MAGKSDIEDALQRLDKLTQEEALTVAAHGLKATKVVDNKVTRVGNDVQGISDKVQDVDTRVEEIGEKAVEGEQIMFNSSFSPPQILIWSGIEKLRQPIAKEFGNWDR